MFRSVSEPHARQKMLAKAIIYENLPFSIIELY